MKRTRRSTALFLVGAILVTVAAFSVASVAIFALLGNKQTVIARLPTIAVMPSDTPTYTATATLTETPTSTATATFTITPSNTPTNTPPATDTPTLTLT